MKTHHPILTEIEAFLADTGMGATYFGKRAVNNSELVARLRAGGAIHFRTEDSVRKFISENSPSSDVSQIDGSLPSKDVGDASANVQGRGAA